jgi:dimeric dUTPase (all-alpha-NTP-PPase superfamily)
MNWNKLQKMQLALDNAILQAKPKMTAEERFNKTLVALSVEGAEISNCSEHFKFWKDNKGKIDDKKFWEVYSNDYYDAKTRRTKYTFDQAHKLTLVEECSDALHFILSLANQLDYEIEFVEYQNNNLEECFLNINWAINNLKGSTPYNLNKRLFFDLIAHYFNYLKLLGITTQELEQAYYDKNEENYRRLREGY